MEGEVSSFRQYPKDDVFDASMSFQVFLVDSFKFCDRFSTPKNTRDTHKQSAVCRQHGTGWSLKIELYGCAVDGQHIEPQKEPTSLVISISPWTRWFDHWGIQPASMPPCLSTVVRHCSKFRDLFAHIPSQLNMRQPRWGVCEYSRNTVPQASQ